MKRFPWARFSFYLLLALSLLLINLVVKQYDRHWDFSAQQRNSLHPSSEQLLQSLQGAVSLTAFVPEYPVMRAEIQALISRYQKVYPEINFTLVDPTTHPAQARQAGITQAGELLLEYQGNSKKISAATESAITNALASLNMNDNRWIVEISGHGEPSLLGGANYDLGVLGQALKKRGYQLFNHNLLETGSIPGNTHLLILAAPRTTLSVQEQKLITEYLSNGGNLLWLSENTRLDTLADYLELRFLPGKVVDAAAADLGIDSPTVAIASQHVDHPITRTLDAPVLLPGSMAIDPHSPVTGWQLTALLNTGSRSWNETDEIKGNISRDPLLDEQQGPLTIGVLLSREFPDQGLQQVVIIGDSDFLSNAYIGNGANRALGLSLINTLTDNPMQISIPVEAATDQMLRWSYPVAISTPLIFLFGIPLLLSLAGFVIRYRRNRR